MSYAIFDVYYGVPVDPEKRAVMGASLAKTDPEFDGETFDLEEYDGQAEASGYLEERMDGVSGVHTPYSGSASDTPMALGIEIDSFDECGHDIKVSSLTLVASDQVKQQYQDLLNSLEPDVRAVIEQHLGEPHVFFLVSTS